MATQANLDYVQKMFVAYLGRAGSASAQEYYADLIDADATLGKAQLFDDLYNSAEAKALYAGKTDDQVITMIFQNCFNRDPAFAGLTYYYDEIQKGTFNILQAAAIIADGADADGAAILAAKQTAADKITTEIGSDAAALASYTSNSAEARASLNKVTDTASATAYDAAAELAAIGTGNQIGASLTLTTGQDIPAMTSDNDTVTGSQTTYTTTDIITDASSTDSDTLNVAATADITATATVTGVENINFTLASFTSGGDNEFDVAANNIGPTTFTLDVNQVGSTVTAAAVTGLGSGSTINTSADFTGAVTLTAGTDNEVITASGAATTYTVTSAGTLTDVTLTSTSTAATTFDTDADGVVTLTSSGDMVIDAVAAKTVVATSSKAISATVDDLDAATSVTLTAGDEITATIDAASTATLSSAGLTSGSEASTIDSSGSLTSLTLSGNGAATDFNVVGANNLAAVTITGDQSVTVIADASDIDALTAGTGNIFTVTDNGSAGTSILQVGTAAGDMDLSGSTVDVVALAVDNNAKTTTVATGQAVVFAVDQTSTTVDGVDTSASTNTVAISLDDGVKTDANDVDITTLVLTDFTSATIDVSADNNAGAAITPSIGTLTASADNTDVTINAGANGITLGNNAHSVGTGSLTINSTGAIALGSGTLTSSSFTTTGSGAVTWTAVSGATNTAVTTGSGGDALTYSADGSLTITTGGGNDEVIINADTTGTSAVTIAMGDGTSDKLTLNEGKDIDTFASLSLSGVEILNLAETGNNGYTGTMAAKTLNGANLVVLGGHAGSTDVFTLTVAATDSTINLSGLNFNAAQFGADAGDNVVVDGSAITTSLNITGTNVKDTITGGSAPDTIVGGAGDDVMVGGGGADTISAASGNNNITGGDGADTLTGGTGADTFTMDGVNDLAGDVIAGGTGTDIISIGAGADTQHDLSTATISSVETLTIATAADTVQIQQGTGIVTVNGFANGTASSFTLLSGGTAFEAAAEGSLAAVDKAGEWFFAEPAGNNATLSYYDEALGAVKTITLAGVDAGDSDNETITVSGGNLVVTIA